MKPSTLPRLAESATAARGGADLLRYGLDGRIPADRLAKGDDGTVTITGIDVLKAGLFNGVVSILDEDLDALAARFLELRDSGVFVPPFRLDHSWSVLSVVGYFDNLETYVRVDETDGQSRTFLRGDVVVTGSLDYTPDQIREAIARGALRSRSSELGYYVTNAGVELPLVFYGCAFVDIPAVEGLAPVSLARLERDNARRPDPRSITTLTTVPTGRLDTMDPAKLARLAALRNLAALSQTEGGTPIEPAAAVELEQLEGEATAAGVTDEQVAAAAEPGEPDPVDPADPGVTDPPSDPDPVDPAAGTEPTDPPAEPGTPAGGTAPAPTGAPADELEQLRAQLAAANAATARLRAAAAEREVARFRTAGAIVEANDAAATALLSHDDDDVRRMAGTLLESVSTRVELGRRRGTTALSSDGNAGGAEGQVINLEMTSDEMGDAWLTLTPAERKLHAAERDAWFANRAENGITD